MLLANCEAKLGSCHEALLIYEGDDFDDGFGPVCPLGWFPTDEPTSSFPAAVPNVIDLILAPYGIEVTAMTITLFWNAEADLDLSVTCGGDLIDKDTSGLPNSCLGSLDISETSE